MSDLSEAEILSRLRESFGQAADYLDRLGRGERGNVYPKLRAELGLIEGCCRQMAAWRSDTRWLPIGLQVAELQKHVRAMVASLSETGKAAPTYLYFKAAEIMRGWQKIAADIETKATGKVGPILPEVKPLPYVRSGRPVQVKANGLLLPPGFEDKRANHAGVGTVQ